MSKLKEAQDFFFFAMQRGWASDAPKQKDDRRPGYKFIRATEHLWVLEDSYYVDLKSMKSAGTTNIWYDDRLLWVMNYGGWYDKEAAAFVKKALLYAYELKIFFGGRGAPGFKKDNLYYCNDVDKNKNKFDDFFGREEVLDSSGKIRGYHRYSGMSLI